MRAQKGYAGTMEKIVIYTDGGARGNPGPAATGVIMQDANGNTIKSYGETIGEATNNEAEYQAVIFALKKIKLLFGREKIKQMAIEIRMDSELAVEQLSNRYKIKGENLQKRFMEIRNLIIDIGGKISFTHVPREQNHLADRLVNEALDKQQGSLL